MSEEETIRYRDAFPKDYTLPKEYAFHMTAEPSEWQCYLFGNRPGGMGMVYRPNKGKEPNWFVRWMMKICFDCLWVKEMKK
jgi:hypothetical protein